MECFPSLSRKAASDILEVPFGERARAPRRPRWLALWISLLVSAFLHALGASAAHLWLSRSRGGPGRDPIAVEFVRVHGIGAAQGLLREEQPARLPRPRVPIVQPPLEPHSMDPPPERSETAAGNPGDTSGGASTILAPSTSQNGIHPGYHDYRPPGDRSLDPTGEATEPRTGDWYPARAQRALQQSCRLSSFASRGSRTALRAVVILRVEADGRIASWWFASRSGDPVYDEVLACAINTTSLPPPPSQLREPYRALGLALTFQAE